MTEENIIPSSPSVTSANNPVAPVIDNNPPSAANPPASTSDDFDETIIPEGSRDNFRKYREAQKAKEEDYQKKLNDETRKRMEYEARWAETQARQQATQQPNEPGEEPDYRTFGTIEEFKEAYKKWAKQVGATEYQGSLTQAQQQQKQQEESAKMLAKGNAARMKYPDFNQVTQPILPIAAQIPALMQFMREVDNSPDVLYHLAKNPAVLDGLSKLQPFAAGQELLRIQAALSTPASKAISQAPAPITPVSTGGDGNVKSVLELVKKDDASDFVARENRKEIRRRKGAE